MQAIIFALFIIIIYNAFLTLRAIIILLRFREYAEGIFSLLLFILAPLIFYGVALLPDGNIKIWAGTFAFVLLVIWLIWGFLLDAVRKNKLQDVAEAKTKQTEPPTRWRLKIVLLLTVTLLVWCYGAFFGIANNTARNIALGFDVLVFYSAVFSLWKWRRYLINPTKERKNEIL